VLLKWLSVTIVKALLAGFTVLNVLFVVNRYLPTDQVTIDLEARGITQASYKNYDEIYLNEKNKLGLSDPPFYFSVHKNDKTFIPLPSLQWEGFNNQYHRFLKNLLKFDFGKSRNDGKSAMNKVFMAIKWTILYVVLSILFVVVLSRWTGRLLSRLEKKGRNTSIYNSFLILLYSVPEFWIATLMVIFLSNNRYGLHLFSIASYGKADTLLSMLDRIWPMVLTSVICNLAYFTLIYKSNVNDENQKPYFTGALAKGLSIRQVIKNHTAPNAFFIMIATLYNSLPAWFAGSVVLENIFNIPGIGRLLFNSFNSGDWNVVNSVIFTVAIITTLGFSTGDLIHSRYNPKENIQLN
jgi:peptide/nickel transport system permease protein